MSKIAQFRKIKKLYINIGITNMRILKKEKLMTQIYLNQKQQPKTNIVSSYEPTTGRTIENQLINGQSVAVSVFEDLNKNGIYDDNEITSVTRNYRDSNYAIEKTYIDGNHDGYSDSIITKKKELFGPNTTEETTLQKDIEEEISENGENSANVYNRKMSTHRSGYYKK